MARLRCSQQSAAGAGAVTVAYTERFFPPLTLTAPAVWPLMGQSLTVAGGTPGFTLVSYLTDPVPNNSRLDYVLVCHEEADDFQWSFSDPVTNTLYGATRTQNVAWITLPAAGTLKTRVDVTKADKSIVTLELTQTIVEPSLKFQTLIADIASGGRTPSDDLQFSLREVCEELKPYIDDAAAATGPKGIPARLLAAVLLMEVLGRPKDSSPKARQIRKGLEGEEYQPRLQAIEDKIEGAFGMKVKKTHLDSIRDVELDLIREFLNEFETLPPIDPRKYELFYSGKKSLGVGQIAQTTLAMASGKIAWREMTEGHMSVALDAIDAEFRTLALEDLRGIFTTLRFPHSNIQAAGQLLAKLKNRAHRFPDMSPLDVLNSDKAIGIIATEYNRGAFDTPLAAMKNNSNGDRAVKYVLASNDHFLLSRYFPDPPL
jgi:hypothetical protein